MMRTRSIISERIRNIRQCTFGWVDHNFLHHGFLKNLSPHELLLYYFLITVADRNGVSFYDYEKICQLLKMTLDDYIAARDRLDDLSLIAFQNGVFQILPLPAATNSKRKVTQSYPRLLTDDFQSLNMIIKNIDHSK